MTIVAERVNNAASIVLDYQLAEDIKNEDTAKQIAKDFGGRIVRIETKITMKEMTNENSFS